MTISEFRDEEIVYIWHRLNECSDIFVKGYTSYSDKFDAYNEYYIEDPHKLWRIFNDESKRRGLDPNTFYLK